MLKCIRKGPGPAANCGGSTHLDDLLPDYKTGPIDFPLGFEPDGFEPCGFEPDGFEPDSFELDGFEPDGCEALRVGLGYRAKRFRGIRA